MTLNDAFVVIGTMRTEMLDRHLSSGQLSRNRRRVEALDVLMVMAQAAEIAADKQAGKP